MEQNNRMKLAIELQNKKACVYMPGVNIEKLKSHPFTTEGGTIISFGTWKEASLEKDKITFCEVKIIERVEYLNDPKKGSYKVRHVDRWPAITLDYSGTDFDEAKIVSDLMSGFPDYAGYANTPLPVEVVA